MNNREEGGMLKSDDMNIFMFLVLPDFSRVFRTVFFCYSDLRQFKLPGEHNKITVTAV